MVASSITEFSKPKAREFLDSRNSGKYKKETRNKKRGNKWEPPEGIQEGIRSGLQASVTKFSRHGGRLIPVNKTDKEIIKCFKGNAFLLLPGPLQDYNLG